MDFFQKRGDFLDLIDDHDLRARAENLLAQQSRPDTQFSTERRVQEESETEPKQIETRQGIALTDLGRPDSPRGPRR